MSLFSARTQCHGRPGYPRCALPSGHVPRLRTPCGPGASARPARSGPTTGRAGGPERVRSGERTPGAATSRAQAARTLASAGGPGAGCARSTSSAPAASSLDLAGDVPRGALIGRTDRQGRLLWSLPKGHIEAGETAEQAAVREVEEETGIAGVILGELGTIDFWFVAEGRRIHKTVQHYLMRRVGGELSDADVEVDEVAWVPLPDIRAQLAYPDERGLVDTAGRMLAESA